MPEQDLRRDPITGFYLSDPRANDAHQNDHYVRHSEPAETSRDYSRPHTIPREEFEAATGRDYDEAIAEYEKNEQDRQEQQAAEARNGEDVNVATGRPIKTRSRR